MSTNSNNQSPLNFVVIGSFIGAGVAVLSSNDKGKKILKTVATSKAMHLAGREVTNILTDQAMNSMKRSMTDYFQKAGDKLPFEMPDQVKEKVEGKLSRDSNEEQDERYESLEEENKNINQRLDKIENMLEQLVDQKS
ncbi:hypothetical protein [Halalkalibacillus halophilus]|uniref:hypothetical protein n=1 Tax=Halalkalibacillus halophilus TaxID=392827 RepID=UPI00041399B2|nr:hypothetical protein [Halalkalibacillus halophilus]